jgi:antitoxin component YwqK of YwqJK toxin-antitoxin module
MEFITNPDIFSLIYTQLDVHDISSLYATCKDIKDVIHSDKDIIYEKCIHIQPHGIFNKLYKNGEMKYQRSYKDGKRYGECKEWYRNGQLELHCFYKDGKKNGKHEKWYDCGKMKCQGIYNNDTIEGELKGWYINGQLRIQCFYKYGLLHGECKRLYENGEILYKEYFINGLRLVDNEYQNDRY